MIAEPAHAMSSYLIYQFAIINGPDHTIPSPSERSKASTTYFTIQLSDTSLGKGLCHPYPTLIALVHFCVEPAPSPIRQHWLQIEILDLMLFI